LVNIIVALLLLSIIQGHRNTWYQSIDRHAYNLLLLSNSNLSRYVVKHVGSTNRLSWRFEVNFDHGL